jgi:hypothetical protein
MASTIRVHHFCVYFMKDMCECALYSHMIPFAHLMFSITFQTLLRLASANLSGQSKDISREKLILLTSSDLSGSFKDISVNHILGLKISLHRES